MGKGFIARAMQPFRGMGLFGHFDKEEAMRYLVTNSRRGLFLALALAALAGDGLWGQETRGTFTGRVKDSSGAMVPGAEVEAIHLATATRTATVSNDSGNYLIPYLSNGTYRVTIAKPGFKKWVREKVDLRLGDTFTLDVSLDVGGSTESIVVEGQAPIFDNTSASLATVIDTKALAGTSDPGGHGRGAGDARSGVVYNTHIRLAKPGMTGGISSLSTDGSTLGAMNSRSTACRTWPATTRSPTAPRRRRSPNSG